MAWWKFFLVFFLQFSWVPDSAVSLRELLFRRPQVSSLLRSVLQVNGLIANCGSFFAVVVYCVFLTGGMRLFTTLLFVVLNDTGFYCPSLHFISLDSAESLPRLYIDDFTKVFVYQFLWIYPKISRMSFLCLRSQFVGSFWSRFHFNGASLNWIHFAHVPSSTDIYVSSMHCCSINARELVIWFRHGPISSFFLTWWWSSKSCYNTAFTAFAIAPPLLCTYIHTLR